MRLSERGYIMSVNLTPQAAQNQKIVCAHGETLNKLLHLPKIFTSEITHRQRCTKLRALVDVSNLHLQNCKSHCKSLQSIIINTQISSVDPASKLQIYFIEFSNIAIDGHVHRVTLSLLKVPSGAELPQIKYINKWTSSNLRGCSYRHNQFYRLTQSAEQNREKIIK